MTQEHFCDMAHDTELDWKFSRFLLGKAETSNKTSSFYIGISPPEERSVQSFIFIFYGVRDHVGVLLFGSWMKFGIGSWCKNLMRILMDTTNTATMCLNLNPL